MSKRNLKNKSYIDFGIILRYIITAFIFGIVTYFAQNLVISKLALSPTKQAGNGILTLYEVHNSGAAFNIFSNQPELIITASLIAVVVISLVVFIASNKITTNVVTSMSMLSCGITMNLLERMEKGYVTDYIYCNFLPGFPVFNIPDILIVIGAVCLVLSILFSRK